MRHCFPTISRLTAAMWGCLHSVTIVVTLLIPLFITCVAPDSRLFISQAMGQSVNLGQLDPAMRRRLVRYFDFEEACENVYDALPRHWFVTGRTAATSDPNFMRIPLHQQMVGKPGYPRFNEVRFNIPTVERGNHSLYLGLDGGNVGAYLAVGAIPAVPGSDYLVTFRASTKLLKHSGAYLKAYFVDSAGKRIDASVRSVGPIRIESQWGAFSVRMTGDYPEAAWIGLEVGIEQPEADPSSPLGNHQVVLEDVQGAAWFDNIAVWQLPRVVVQTQSRTNILHDPDRPRLEMEVRDLTGRSLKAGVTIYDAQRRVVAQQSYGVGGGEPTAWSWTPTIEEHGWYLVDFKVYEGTGKPIARSITSFIWMGGEGALSSLSGRRFVLDATGLPADQLALLPDMVESMGLRSVYVSAFDQRDTRQQIDRGDTANDRAISELVAQGRYVGVGLAPLPVELTQSQDLDRDDVADLFQKDSSVWLPYILPVMVRHGQRVRHWRLGPPSTADLFYQGSLPSKIEGVLSALRDVTPGPIAVLPWVLNQSRRPDLDDRGLVYAMRAPASVQPGHLGEYLEPWMKSPEADVTLHLETQPADRMDQPRRITDMALRMIHAWEAGVHALAIDRPWTRGTDRTITLLPDPVAGVFSTVAHRLADRQALGRMPIGPGLECVVFSAPSDSSSDDHATGMLAMWNRSASDDPSEIETYLGPNPVMIDVWGNRQPLTTVDRKQRVRVGKTPIFIEGVDTQLALFRAGFTIDNPFIESRQTPHDRVLTIRNPWKRTISGSVFITDPRDWTISPRKYFFSIASGQSEELPVRIMLPISEVAGRKTLVARMDFIADRRYQTDLTVDLEVGLSDIDFDATLAMEAGTEPGTLDAAITSVVSNTGLKPVSLYAFAALPGFPRQEHIISRLLPGQTIVRRFRFKDAAGKVEGVPIRVGLREAAGPAVLNKILEPDER
ncbi:MAG: hypothetical protein GC164_07295 [Phycisphaera sp.]|nr:hypothetical protein [Phycisphaera sp.]